VSRIAGYKKGIDHEVYLFVLNTLVGVASVILRNHIERFRDGLIGSEMLAEEARPHLLRLFDAVADYAENIQRQGVDDEFSHSRLRKDAYDYHRVLRISETHRKAFLADPSKYVERYFSKPFQAHEWLGKEWRRARHLTGIVREVGRRTANKALSLFSPSAAAAREIAAKRYVDGGALADRIIRTIDQHSGDRPLFLWTHFLDTHVPYCPGRAGTWYREAPDYLRVLGYDPGLDPSVPVSGRPTTDADWDTWSAYYDATVRYIDEQIGRIVQALDRKGIADETLLVFCADHGEELGDHGDISHHFRFYSHNVRVPLLFHGAGVSPGRSDALATLIDVVPAMASICGTDTDPQWEGEDPFSAAVAKREHIVLESFHGGSCAFEHKPVYIAARNKRFNFLWKEDRDPSDKYSADGPELYDIIADPGERNNIYSVDHPEIAAFERAIALRLAEISEFAPGRFDGKFATIAPSGATLAAK
jgi:hypothetical protein